jgi:hypothetical protein
MLNLGLIFVECLSPYIKCSHVYNYCTSIHQPSQGPSGGNRSRAKRSSSNSTTGKSLIITFDRLYTVCLLFRKVVFSELGVNIPFALFSERTNILHGSLWIQVHSVYTVCSGPFFFGADKISYFLALNIQLQLSLTPTNFLRATTYWERCKSDTWSLLLIVY